MKTMLITKNIFIDTEIFVANCYFANDKLMTLAEFGKEGIVNLYMTEITKNEIQNNIKEELQETLNEINIFKKRVQSKGKILRNIEGYEVFFELPSIDLDLDFNTINKKLDKFIKQGEVKLIPVEFADIRSIINKYFSKEKPFGSKGKKNEFLDAIVLSSVENWCKQEKEKMYVLSGDGDFTGYSSEYFITKDKLRNVIDIIIRQVEQSKKLEKIDFIFKISEIAIIKSISEKFSQEITENSYYDISLHNISVFNVILHDYSITSQKDYETYIELDVDIEFEALVEYEDYSISPLEEDNMYLFRERKAEKKTFCFTQTAEIYLEHDLVDEENVSAVNCTFITIPNSDIIKSKLKD